MLPLMAQKSRKFLSQQNFCFQMVLHCIPGNERPGGRLHGSQADGV